MQFQLLDQCKNAFFVLENFFAKFYQPLLVGLFLLWIALHGPTNIFGLLSVLGYFWGLLRVFGYFFQEKAEKLLAVLAIFLASSFLLSESIPFVIFVPLGLLGAYALLFSKGDFAFVRQSPYSGYFLLSLMGLFFWGAQKGPLALMADNYHPLYEFGIGRCVEWSNWLSNCLPKDMAYLGGEVRYHFLATRLPFLFSYLARSDYFFSITSLVPVFFLFLFSVIADVFNTEMSWAGSYEKRFIFLALVGIFVVPSFGLGVALSLLTLVLLGKRKFFSAVMSLFLLLLTKFTLFMVVFTAWGIFFCWDVFVTKKIDLQSLIAVIATIVPGAFLYIKFLAGAHGHCLWVVLPWVLINPFRPHFLTQAAPFDLAEFIWIILQCVAGIGLLIYAYKKKQRLIALMGACFSVGILYRYFLLSEFVEGNNFQFTTLNGILLSVILFFLISDAGPFGSKLIFHQALKACCQRLLHICFKIGLTFKALWAFILGAIVPMKAALIFFFMGMGNTIDMRSIKAWEFLESRKDEYGAVVGKHYEIRGHYSHDSDLPGDRGFLASGFSGKQLFAEGYCSRGTMMNADYPERVAHILAFFRKFVVLSESSQESFRLHFDSIEYLMLPAYPMSQSPSPMVRLLHKFSLGREWHRVNYEKKLYQEMQQILTKLMAIDEITYFIEYYKNFNMAYLVLENGDKPQEELLKFVDILYKNDAAMVLFFR
jgi:hypothetical protein